MLEDFTLKPQGSADAADMDESGLARPELLERFIAKFIDALIVGALFAFPSFVGVLAGATYILISDGLFNGSSVGKRIIGLKVVTRDDGIEPCDFRRSIVRNAEFGILILLYIIIGWIPYAGKFIVGVAALAVAVVETGVIITDEASGARIGDRIADTTVVADKPPKPPLSGGFSN